MLTEKLSQPGRDAYEFLEHAHLLQAARKSVQQDDRLGLECFLEDGPDRSNWGQFSLLHRPLHLLPSFEFVTTLYCGAKEVADTDVRQTHFLSESGAKGTFAGTWATYLGQPGRIHE